MHPTLAALTLVLACTLPACASETVGADLQGVASVIDGDTIEIHGARIRLNGIDAPESGQLCQDPRGTAWRCGQQAALALSDRIGTASRQLPGDRHRPLWPVCGGLLCGRRESEPLDGARGLGGGLPPIFDRLYRRRGRTPGPAIAGSDRAVSTCPGIGVRHVAAVRKRHRRCRGCNNSPGKTGPAARAGPALRSAVAQRRAGICRTAPGAAGSTATMTASPARASAERDSGGPASRRGVVSPAMAAGSSVHCGYTASRVTDQPPLCPLRSQAATS